MNNDAYLDMSGYYNEDPELVSYKDTNPVLVVCKDEDPGLVAYNYTNTN